jgi:hypothetical protein
VAQKKIKGEKKSKIEGPRKAQRKVERPRPIQA